MSADEREIKLKYLPNEFNIDTVAWKKVDEVKDYWYIYERTDVVLEDIDYIVFLHRKKNNRQYRPVPNYENSNGWFLESVDLGDCYQWIRDTMRLENK